MTDKAAVPSKDDDKKPTGHQNGAGWPVPPQDDSGKPIPRSGPFVAKGQHFVVNARGDVLRD